MDIVSLANDAVHGRSLAASTLNHESRVDAWERWIPDDNPSLPQSILLDSPHYSDVFLCAAVQ